MSPALLNLLFLGIEEAIKLTPGLVAEFQTLFSKADVTEADWIALRTRVLSKAYEDYVPQSGLIPAPAPAK